MIDKNCNARKPFRPFTEVLDTKRKTSVFWVSDDNSKRKEIISGSMLWSIIKKRKGHTKINEQVNTYLYNLILQNPQVVY